MIPNEIPSEWTEDVETLLCFPLAVNSPDKVLPAGTVFRVQEIFDSYTYSVVVVGNVFGLPVDELVFEVSVKSVEHAQLIPLEKMEEALEQVRQRGRDTGSAWVVSRNRKKTRFRYCLAPPLYGKYHSVVVDDQGLVRSVVDESEVFTPTNKVVARMDSGLSQDEVIERLNYYVYRRREDLDLEGQIRSESGVGLLAVKNLLANVAFRCSMDDDSTTPIVEVEGHDNYLLYSREQQWAQISWAKTQTSWAKTQGASIRFFYQSGPDLFFELNQENRSISFSVNHVEPDNLVLIEEKLKEWDSKSVIVVRK